MTIKVIQKGFSSLGVHVFTLRQSFDFTESDTLTSLRVKA